MYGTSTLMKRLNQLTLRCTTSKLAAASTGAHYELYLY